MNTSKLLLISFVLFHLSMKGQDTADFKPDLPSLTHNTISYIQFNTIRDAASIGMQGRNFSLRSFSNLPNTSFAEIHNSVNIDGYLDKNNSVGLGLYYSIDNWSNLLFRNTLGFGFKKKIKNFHLGINIEKNTINKDSTQLIFGDMIDPREGIIYPTYDVGSSDISTNYISFKPSLIYTTQKLRVGLSIDNITEANNSLTLGNSIITKETHINASYIVRLSRKWTYTPMLNYSGSKYFNVIKLSNILTYYAPRKIHFLAISYTDRKWLSGQYGINFNNRLKFFGEVNFPIYFANYFPISAQLGIQFTSKPKK